MWAHGPRLGDVSALFPFPAHIHPIARDDDRHRHSEGRRLLPPGGVVVHHPLLEFDAPLGEATPRLRAGRSVAQGVEDSFAHFLCLRGWYRHDILPPRTGREEPDNQQTKEAMS